MNNLGILLFNDNDEYKVISAIDIPYNFLFKKEKVLTYIEKNLLFIIDNRDKLGGIKCFNNYDDAAAFAILKFFGIKDKMFLKPTNYPVEFKCFDNELYKIENIKVPQDFVNDYYLN